MRVVSSARRAGGIGCMYPGQDLRTTPWPLATAVGHALSILGWMELPDDQQPPEAIWLHPRLLGEHFDRVRDRMARGPGMEPVEDMPMMQNELTSGLRGKR